VIVVVANVQDSAQLQLGESLYNTLRSAGIDALLDDRSERAGVKFKDADLIGIPWRIVVGREAAEGRVELVERSSRANATLAKEDALNRLLESIPEQLRI
jgi:prolyl-tRNA synthetase